jgi:aspartyl-tRNA(Asn)/glutamyl-tRNA(Gln) amidotransferase subunit A
MDPLDTATIESVSAAIGARELSPVELIDSTLERIESLNETLNAYVTVPADYARARAREAEREILADGPRGPLHGIPYSLKDMIETAGIRTTLGWRSHRDYVPERSATVHERLEQAGAILVGKAHTHFRRSTPVECRNPWDITRSPGISSAGSGASLATAMCLASIGTDTGGSVRIPASWCGVVGLKQTPGLVSGYGAFAASSSYDLAGPMARTVRDAGLILQAVAGYDANDPATLPGPVPDFLAEADGVSGVRVGVLTQFLEAPCDPEVAASVKAAVSVLDDLGALVGEASLPGAAGAWRALAATAPESVEYFEEHLTQQQFEELDDDLKEYLERARSMTLPAYLAAKKEQVSVRQEALRLLESVDVIVAPTTLTLPWAYGETGSTGEVMGKADGGGAADYRTMIAVTGIGSVAGLPSLSVPCGFSDEGWPVGLQLMGRPFAESLVLRLGQAYEAATDWSLRVPPLVA